MGKAWVVRCPYCKLWQSKPERAITGDLKKATCVYCNAPFRVVDNGTLIDNERDAPRLVAINNMTGKKLEGFGTGIIEKKDEGE